MQRIIRLPLYPTKQQVAILWETSDQFTQAFNHICEVGWLNKEKNGVKLHHLVYYPLRSKFPDLHSDHINQARIVATGALKAGFTRAKKGQRTSCPKSKLHPTRFIASTFKVYWDQNRVRLNTTWGRQTINIGIPDYYRKYLGGRVCIADLFNRKGRWWLHVTIDLPQPQIEKHSEVIGVDLGITKPATTSNNKFLGPKVWKEIENRIFRQRKACQKKGTRASKRKRRKNAGKQARFRRECNHILSKQIVNSVSPGGTIVLENLTNILKRVKAKKRQRRRLHSWSFSQLRNLVLYKAEAKGICVALIDPRHTSQVCSKCGYCSKFNRTTQANFHCKSCGFQLNADLNASRNIRDKYLASLGMPSTSRPLSTGPTGAQPNVPASNSGQVQTGNSS